MLDKNVSKARLTFCKNVLNLEKSAKNIAVASRPHDAQRAWTATFKVET